MHLDKLMNYQGNIARTDNLIGIGFTFSRVGRFAITEVNQVDYGHFWVNKFESEFDCTLTKFSNPDTAPIIGPPGAPAPPGRFQSVARSYVMACFYAARMTLFGMLHACVALSRRFEHWGLDLDVVEPALRRIDPWHQHPQRQPVCEQP